MIQFRDDRSTGLHQPVDEGRSDETTSDKSVSWASPDAEYEARRELDGPIASVIVPAYNESRTIGRCLSALTIDMRAGEFEIIVICNGCTDKTADIARTFPGVTVLETEIGNKAAALTLGDEHANVFPRIYLDADVVMTTDSARKLIAALQDDRHLCGAPKLRVRDEGRPYSIRAYYRIWQQLPYVRQHMVGAGVYALSQHGRSRFDQFPNVLAEDEFIRLQFAEHERTNPPGSTFYIDAPTSLRSLLKIRMRWQRSCNQLHDQFPELKKHDSRQYGRSLRMITSKFTNWPALVVYIVIWGCGKIGSKYQLLRKTNSMEWCRDDTTRVHAKPM